MRIVRNVNYIKERKRRAKWSILAGLTLLGAIMALAFVLKVEDPRLIMASYVPLIAGIILFNMGMQHLVKWGRSPRNDELIDNHLRGLGEKYVLIHYARVGKRIIEHILIHPGGVLTFTARELPGKVAYSNGRWRRASMGFGRMFGMGGPQIGQPSADADADVATLRNFLRDAQLEVDVDGAIVFLHPHIELEVAEPDYPVMNGEGLPAFVKTLPTDANLGQADRQALVGLLGTGAEVEQAQPETRRRPVKRKAA